MSISSSFPALSPPFTDRKMGNEFITAPYGITRTVHKEGASPDCKKTIRARED